MVGLMNTSGARQMFVCENCGKEFHDDKHQCPKCESTESIKPIPQTMYKFYLNGVLWGTGDLDKMHRLFTEYVLEYKMYDKRKVSIDIVEIEL